MILAFRYTPGPSAEHTNVQDPGDWLSPVYLWDEKLLGNADDAEYAIFTPTKATIDEGQDADPQLPKSFQFSHRVSVKGNKVIRLKPKKVRKK